MKDEYERDQISLFAQDSSSLKMSLESSPQTTEKHSASSLKSSQKSQTAKYQYLCLKEASGNLTEKSWVMGGALHTPNIVPPLGAYLNGGREFVLSAIIVRKVPLRYYLSSKACLGILRRSDKRRRPLPPILEKALIRQAGIPLGHPYNPIEVEFTDAIDVIAIEGNGGRESHHGSGYRDDGTMYTLNTIEQHCVAIHEAEGQDITLSDKAYSLTTSGGKCGQGNPVVMTYDARGGGDGVTVNNLVGGHNNRITDYTAIVIE